MRFTLMLGIGGYQDYLAVAQAAEQAGWTSISLPDSIFFPQTSESEYPYADTAAVRQFIEASPFIEPFVAMTAMAMVTKRIRFYPGVMKVPVRQPLLLAKSLSSAAVMSGNRITLGAGVGPWKEEFTYNGLKFEPRGKMMDECLHIIRAALRGDYFEFHGSHYDFGPLKMSPVPTEPVPILIGGHSKAALSRAARLGDGWMSANTDFDTLKSLIGQLAELRAQHGRRQGPEFEIHGLDQNAQTLDDFRRLRDIGVTDICTSPWNPYNPALDLQAKLDGIRRFGEAIIARAD